MPEPKFIDHFDFYPQHILSSVDYLTMSASERGVYLTLFITSWNQKPRQCYLKISPQDICELCKISMAEWQAMEPKIMAKFKVDADGYMYNEKLLGIYKEASREGKSSKKEQAAIIGSKCNYPWDEFWRDYDKKVGSIDRLLPKWLKLSDEDRDKIKAHIPNYKDATPDKTFRKNPETYLNQRAWEHELIIYKKPEPFKTATTGKTKTDYEH